MARRGSDEWKFAIACAIGLGVFCALSLERVALGLWAASETALVILVIVGFRLHILRRRRINAE
jgi:hypothetical protein